MPPRFFVDPPLPSSQDFALPAGVARHVQVRRLQPQTSIVLFDGSGSESQARIVRIGRSSVEVRIESTAPVDRELATPVTLAVGMPANERMDALVEKATELGVARLQPLVCERSVLRLAGERADKKVAHWQAVAVAACEQCGRTRVPRIEPVRSLAAWLAAPPVEAASTLPARWLLAPRDGLPWPDSSGGVPVVVLSGPEGGLTDAEEAAARRHGFVGLSLGPRILRADTAPLAALARIGGWPVA